MNEVSIEELESLIHCPAKYHLAKTASVTYMKKEDELDQAFKAIVEFFYISILDKEEVTEDILEKKLSSFLFNMKSFSLFERKGKIKKSRERNLIDLVKIFGQHEVGYQQEVLSYKEGFSIKITEELMITDEIPLIRKVDGITEIVVFVTEAEKSNPFWIETNLRITIYDMAYRKIYNEAPGRICVYNIPKKAIYYTHRRKLQYDRANNIFKHFSKILDEQDFYTRESSACSVCTSRYSCLDYVK